MPKKNITSPIRRGFHYQDLWALKLCGDWLLDPDKYKWIHIEVNPTEKPEFYLDDIVLLDKRNLHQLYQAKFKVYHQYQWSWDDLLKKRKGKTGEELPSLLEKWAISFQHFGVEKIGGVFFVTNANLSNGIKQFLFGQKIDIQKLKTENSSLYEQIKDEIGDDKSVEIFFSKFEFYFELETLVNIENKIKSLFYDKLCVTKAGFDSLCLALKREAGKQQTIQLRLEQIRTWCEFDSPKPLNEKFEVPSDFQFFNEDAHKHIFQDLQDSKGGIKVIFGKPGAGKSVYLSQLSENLKEKGVMVIKHHYHINPADSSSFERLNSERVIEAIRAQFKSSDYKKHLGELSNKNSKEIPLNEFISTVAQNLSNDDKNFVIIIDGLDHVVREKDVQELKSFLDEIFYPKKGLWIVFGMQPQVRNEISLQSIFNKCPRGNWIEIRGLNKKAVSDLVLEKNITCLKLPGDRKASNDLLDKLYTLSQGNPLHLRYILTQLKNLLDKNLVTKYECKNLIPYGDSIEKYYESLWNTLEKEETKTFLLTFISVDFQFTRQQFIECISSFENPSALISKNFKKVEHLIAFDLRGKLRIDLRGKLRIYHNSFRVFLYKQKEWEEQKHIIKLKVKNWLENSHYENLKWAELRKLEYELGDNEPILEIDRKWLIESIIHPRNPSQIESQLKLSSRAAFNKNDFAKALKISHIQTYYKNAKDFLEESANLIWIESIKVNPDFINDLILSELPSDVLAVVADIADQYGQFCIIDGIIEILRERLAYQEYRVGEIPLEPSTIIEVIPYDRTHEVERVYNYIIQFKDLGISPVLFEFYAEKLLSLDQKTKFEKLLKLDLNEEERNAILECCIKHDLKHKTSSFIKFIRAEKTNSPVEQLYLILQNKKLSFLPELPDYKDFPSTIPEYGPERGKWTTKFHNFFLTGVIYGLCEKQKEIEEWIKSAPSQWHTLATIALFRAALKIANTIQEENKINYKDIFEELKNLPDIKWPEDKDKSGFKFALKHALTNILKDTVLIKHFLNDSPKIDKKCYQIIISSPFFLQKDLFEVVLDLNQLILEKEVYNLILNERNIILQNTVNYFPERSEEYSKLATLSKLYQEKDKDKDLLIKAADNLLGYGNHKDTYLFEVLETIELCAKAGIDAGKINNWTHRIIPLITNVREYTDGDETHHLPNYLAKFLFQNNKNLLFKFYFDQADNEELDLVQDLLKYVIRSLSFESDVEIALSSTALDKGSFEELKEKAKKLKGAKVSLRNIQEYLGEINYKDEDHSNSLDLKEKKINYAELTPEKLEEYLSKLKTKWDFEKYVTCWAKYWIEQDDKQKIYNLIKYIVFKKTNIQSVSGEVLDILYPLAYEFDNSEAFRFLCSAQTNNHGWSIYWTNKKKAENRWNFVKEKYPKRYLEFFKSSVNYNVPIPRSVDFFIRFDDLDKALEITEASVEFAEELMADINLQNPDWTKSDFQEIDELDLLFQRLVWPSPLVRERAATAIGDLLANSPKKEEIYTKLLKWIGDWKIESIIAIGLLPIIKSFQICKKKADLAHIKIEDVCDSIQANSIVIENLLSEIVLQTKEEIDKSPCYIPSKELPASYEINDFFDKYIKTILAPIYFDRAQKIEENTAESFIKLWEYNAKLIAQEKNIEFKSNHSFYGRNKNDKCLTGFSTKVSEVYRSAFLRVLHDLYDNGLIPPDFYLEYAFATLPVDLSFWKILPSRAPEWWPKLINPKTDNKEEEISTIQFKEPIENIISYKRDNKIILAAEGAIEPGEGWKENPTHSFSLIGFGYKVLGADLPEPEEVSEAILHTPQTLLIPTKATRSLSFLENSVHFDIPSDFVQIKDLVVFPLATRNRDLTIRLWQYFGGKNQPFNVNEKSRSGLGIVTKNNKWVYEDENNTEIVVFKYCLNGLQERYEFEMPLPHEHYVLVDEKYLTKKLKDNGLRLGYVLQTTYRSQKYSYDEIKKINNFKFINVSNII